MKGLEEIQHHSTKQDVISFNGAISTFEKCQQWEESIDLVVEMRHQGLATHVISYNAAISACEECQQWENAIGLLLDIQ